MAFGTGEHPTTAMSLRLLEQLTRRWKRGWSVVDLGTGSGILALAAKRFGAGDVVGMDNDPTATSTAKSNARLNKIHGVVFRFGDVLKREWPRNADVITANLYKSPAHRNRAEIKSGPLADFLRDPAQPERRIASRHATQRHRDQEYQAPRQMDRHPGVF